MRTEYKWKVKSLKLKEDVVCEFEHEALQKIGNKILEGRFTVELEKEELVNV